MRIIVVSDPKRRDFYNYIVDNLGKEHEIFLLWHYKKTETDSLPYGENTKLLYWKDYFTPKTLLQKVRPDRVLFFEAIDFWQIPLIIACHEFKVTSFFIEHGVGNSIDMVVARFSEVLSHGKRMLYYLKKLVFGFLRAVRSRIFFMSASKYLSEFDRSKYLKLVLYYKMFTPIHALSQLKFRRRTPHFAILFNRNNIDPFIYYNEIERENIFTGGVPFFDKYFLRKLLNKEHMIFIEHPYLEFKMFDWTDSFHESIARTLEHFAITNGIKIIIKLHPRSNFSNWSRYKLHSLIDIKQSEDLTEEMLSAKLVLGYSSTLINALIICKKNIVLLGWHPKSQIEGDDFSKTGLCHVSFHRQDLFEKYKTWVANNLSLKNDEAYQDFIAEYNYPFDGKATERLINAILENEIS